MGEKGAALTAFESMADPLQEREEPTVAGPERRGLGLHLVHEKDLRGETSAEQLFAGSGASLKKQKMGPDSRWIDVSEPNEDAFEVDSKIGLALVADGFGGHEAGEKASAAAAQTMKMTVRRELEVPFFLSSEQQKKETDVEPELRQARAFVEETLKLDPSRFASDNDVEHALRQGLIEANQAVIRETKNGGTTISAAVIYETLDGKRRAKFANRGDSRIYLYRKGVLRQLTKDDSLVQELQDRKLLIDDEDVEAALHPVALELLKKIDPQGAAQGDYETGTKLRRIRNSVTKGLSAAERQVERTPIGDVELEPGDMLLQVTDGLIDNLTRKRTSEVIQENIDRSSQDIADELVRESKGVAHSKDPRAKEDDVTVGVERIKVGRSLRMILERRLDEWKESLKGVKYPQNILLNLYAVRNQLEFAVEGHPGNEKLVALRDHVLARLQLLDSRARELERSGPNKKRSEDTIKAG